MLFREQTELPRRESAGHLTSPLEGSFMTYEYFLSETHRIGRAAFDLIATCVVCFQWHGFTRAPVG